mgnify:CR=1 FL=1
MVQISYWGLDPLQLIQLCHLVLRVYMLSFQNNCQPWVTYWSHGSYIAYMWVILVNHGSYNVISGSTMVWLIWLICKSTMSHIWVTWVKYGSIMACFYGPYGSCMGQSLGHGSTMGQQWVIYGSCGSYNGPTTV